jgi:MoxR-like ATPase
MAINVPSVSPSQAKEIIKLLEPLGVSVMLWGPPGVGKSEIVRQVIEERKGRLIDLRLSHKIASDIGGLPMVDRDT